MNDLIPSLRLAVGKMVKIRIRGRNFRCSAHDLAREIVLAGQGKQGANVRVASERGESDVGDRVCASLFRCPVLEEGPENLEVSSHTGIGFEGRSLEKEGSNKLGRRGRARFWMNHSNTRSHPESPPPQSLPHPRLQFAHPSSARIVDLEVLPHLTFLCKIRSEIRRV